MVNSFDFDNRNAVDPEVVEGRGDAEHIAGAGKRVIRWRIINC